MYDLIGDIHGYADEIEALLSRMDYKKTVTGWQHSSRKVLFLGNFVDRGPQQLETVAIALSMVENQHALAVMGSTSLIKTKIGATRFVHNGGVNNL